jgi:endoribonuclease LACTB2
MRTDISCTVVNIGYLSTNYWVVSAGQGRLLIDLGYPGTMGMMRRRMAQMNVPLNEVCFALATHFHIDHAGLGQELKLAGVTLLVLESQVQAVSLMKPFTKPRDRYLEILPEGNRVITFSESRDLLAGIGIAGEILSTPGHTNDSVSVLLDDGKVFTGDLPPFMTDWDDEQGKRIKSSWRLLHDQGAKIIYPAHGPIRKMEYEIQVWKIPD